MGEGREAWDSLKGSLNPDIPEASVVSMWAECTVSVRLLNFLSEMCLLWAGVMCLPLTAPGTGIQSSADFVIDCLCDSPGGEPFLLPSPASLLRSETNHGVLLSGQSWGNCVIAGAYLH